MNNSFSILGRGQAVEYQTMSPTEKARHRDGPLTALPMSAASVPVVQLVQSGGDTRKGFVGQGKPAKSWTIQGGLT